MADIGERWPSDTDPRKLPVVRVAEDRERWLSVGDPDCCSLKQLVVRVGMADNGKGERWSSDADPICLSLKPRRV